jgi:pseudouridine synthase
MKERIQKIISEHGIASRREAEKMILEGRVKLNGSLVKLGDKANPQQDKIEIDGKRLTKRPPLVYILLHKPKGVVCTCEDPQNRKTVIDLLEPKLRSGYGIHPVGRLDRESTGALLLTNDGELTLNLTHPRYHLPKTYRVWLQGHPNESILQQWSEGVILDHKKTSPAQVKILAQKTTKTLLEIVLNEGRNRQIRKTAELLGFPVIRLHRTAIGSLKLADLPCGEYRFLEPWEVKKIKSNQSAQTKLKST